MSFENVLVELKENLALVTINRPTKLNALNKKTIEELHVAFKSLDENSDIKVILITGAERKLLLQEQIFLNLQILVLRKEQNWREKDMKYSFLLLKIWELQ